LTELKNDLFNSVKLTSKDRIYVISTDAKKKEKILSGQFLFGGRKRAPWIGYSDEDSGVDVASSL
jgi:hypothetical protein